MRCFQHSANKGCRLRTTIAISFTLLLAGCGSEGAYPIVPVTGTVKYTDGSLIPASRITLKFISAQPAVDSKTHPKPGLGEVNVEDGSFLVSTYNYDDGLIRGKHMVTIQSLDEKNWISNEIPKRYADLESTPFEVNTDDLPFEFLIDKQ